GGDGGPSAGGWDQECSNNFDFSECGRDDGCCEEDSATFEGVENPGQGGQYHGWGRGRGSHRRNDENSSGGGSGWIPRHQRDSFSSSFSSPRPAHSRATAEPSWRSVGAGSSRNNRLNLRVPNPYSGDRDLLGESPDNFPEESGGSSSQLPGGSRPAASS
ncbi:unnamed protein product, partial [Discosporangium mesarthrocarpum]